MTVTVKDKPFFDEEDIRQILFKAGWMSPEKVQEIRHQSRELGEALEENDTYAAIKSWELLDSMLWDIM